MSLQNHIANDTIIVFADSSIYSKDALLKCLYWYGDKFHTNLRQENSSTYVISLQLVNGETEKLDLDMYLQKLERDIIDYNLRDIVTKETMNIRDLLVAKAFANGEFDEEPQGNISDPVGYDITNQM